MLVSRGEMFVAQQPAIIAALKQPGHKLDCSKALLRTLEEAQRLHIALCDQQWRILRDAPWDASA